MLEQARAELAPTGVLRAGINMSNFLLVTGKTPGGDPEGVSPDMARAVADRLGVPLELVPFKTPGELADAAVDDLWDIGNIGAEPEREDHRVHRSLRGDRGDVPGTGGLTHPEHR